MTTKEAIKLLMQIPIYFRLEVMGRLALVKNFCLNYPPLAETSYSAYLSPALYVLLWGHRLPRERLTR